MTSSPQLMSRKSLMSETVLISEAVLSFMEGMPPEYGALGEIKQPTGSAIATAASSNNDPKADGALMLIAANPDPFLRRLAALIVCGLLGPGSAELNDLPREDAI
jgi:hypothetical protein